MSDINPVFEAAMGPFTKHIPRARMARCSCGSTVPSSKDLAFFQDMSADSDHAKNTCKCGYSIVAHERAYTDWRPRKLCDKFTPTGARSTDLYYCGCRGWD